MFVANLSETGTVLRVVTMAPATYTYAITVWLAENCASPTLDQPVIARRQTNRLVEGD